MKRIVHVYDNEYKKKIQNFFRTKFSRAASNTFGECNGLTATTMRNELDSFFPVYLRCDKKSFSILISLSMLNTFYNQMAFDLIMNFQFGKLGQIFDFVKKVLNIA